MVEEAAANLLQFRKNKLLTLLELNDVDLTV